MLDEAPTFDLQNGTVDIPATTTLFKSASIEPLLDEDGNPNGWYRCSVLFVPTSTSGTLSPCLTNNTTANNHPTFTGDGVSGIYMWGAQLEETGSYITSYIPTTTATVERIADHLFKDDIIGQSEGTLYANVWTFGDGSGNKVIGITDSTDSNKVIITIDNNAITGQVISGTSTQASFATSSYPTTTFRKIAISYGPNYSAFLIDGNKIG